MHANDDTAANSACLAVDSQNNDEKQVNHELDNIIVQK